MFPPLTTVSEMGLASVERKTLGSKKKQKGTVNITAVPFFSGNTVIEKAISGKGLRSEHHIPVVPGVHCGSGKDVN